MSEAPNQEGNLFADSLSLAVPDVSVFTRSEKPNTQKLGEELEALYNAFINEEMPSDLIPMRHMACDAGIGVRAMDEVGRFFEEQPKRKKAEEGEDYLGRVDEYRQGAGWPVTMRDIDPLSFVYIENQKHDQVIFGAESRRVREAQVKEGGEYTKVGDFIAIRTPKMIYHFWSETGGLGTQDAGGMASSAKLLYQGENRFGHTGYFLYRGRYSGSDKPWLRYQPYIMATLNIAQVKGLLATLQTNYAIQAATHWIEHDLSKAGESNTPEARAYTLTKKVESRGVASRTAGGTVAADLEPGAHIKFREITGELTAIIQMLEAEEQRYRHSDVLAARDIKPSSGREFLHMFEAAGNQLVSGFRARATTTKEILTVLRRTLFERPEYLGKKDAVPIYIAQEMEGQGEQGDKRRQDMLSIGPEHNIPHAIKVDVSQQSQMARLAMLEEGMKLKGSLSSDTIDDEFMQLKDKGLENRRRFKDMVRAGVLPGAAQDGVDQAKIKLGKTPIANPPVVVPPSIDGTQAVQATAGPPAVMPEQAAMSVNGQQMIGQ